MILLGRPGQMGPQGPIGPRGNLTLFQIRSF